LNYKHHYLQQLFGKSNFLLHAQKLSLLLSNSESEYRTQDLAKVVGSSPLQLFSQIKFRWEDFCVAQKPKVSIKYDEEISNKNKAMLLGDDASANNKNIKANFKTTRAALKFTDELILRWPKISRADVELEPYCTEINPIYPGDSNKISIHGATFSVEFPGRRSIRLWLDHGVSKLKSSASKFQQIGADVTWPTKLLHSFEYPFRPLMLRNASTEIDIIGTLEAKTMTSGGPGRIPLYHYSDMGTEKVLRGDLSSVPASSYAALKADILLAADFPMLPGVFIDAAVFRTTDDKRIRKRCTTGFSIRAMGFLVELGLPLFSESTQAKAPIRMYFGIDSPGR